MTPERSIAWRWLVALATVLIVGIALMLIARTVLRGEGELARKGAYAALQSLMEEHKNDDPVSFPKRDRVEGDVTYQAIGVTSAGSSSSAAWVMLNMTGPRSSLLVVPRGAKPVLPCAAVDQLALEADTDPAVVEHFRSSCVADPAVISATKALP
ncbi:MAG TPA: hypothetical protein VN813_14150 [Luteibacter sp.]|jgi:hypothetical protein|nr:hypothetical protein [Luteibacter sp.]